MTREELEMRTLVRESDVIDRTDGSELAKAFNHLWEKYIEQEPKTGHWSRKTKVDAYDIAGVKTWGIKCQCDRCDFTTIVVEDFGYYKFCPNCGAKMEVSE